MSLKHSYNTTQNYHPGEFIALFHSIEHDPVIITVAILFTYVTNTDLQTEFSK